MDVDTPTVLFNNVLDVQRYAIRRNKTWRFLKSILSDDIIVNIQNPKQSTKQLPELRTHLARSKNRQSTYKINCISIC